MQCQEIIIPCVYYSVKQTSGSEPFTISQLEHRQNTVHLRVGLCVMHAVGVPSQLPTIAACMGGCSYEYGTLETCGCAACSSVLARAAYASVSLVCHCRILIGGTCIGLLVFRFNTSGLLEVVRRVIRV